MPIRHTLLLPTALEPGPLWQAAARAGRDWLAAQGLNAADAVALLPFAELLTPARAAWAETGGWLPRLHTTRTLAAALGPPRTRSAGELSGDAATDIATARQLLRGHTWADAWLQRDARAFDAALQRLVRTAHTLAATAAAVHPDEREDWWARLREQAVPHAGPGATDRLLLRTAIEWTSLSEAADSDRLFAHRPVAWIVITLGGADALADCIARRAQAQGVPVLELVADPAGDDPFDGAPSTGTLEVEAAPDAETEAMAAAWRVHQLLREGVQPVALIAQDRALVRRVRALLERLAIEVADETGWSLATTRAGAHATAALRAVRTAAADDRLDWLKADLAEVEADDLVVLEKLWRGQRIDDSVLRARAQALWQRELLRLDGLAQPRRRTLAQWLQAFDTLLFGAPHSAAWRDDAAARQLRRALKLGEYAQVGDGAWSAAAALTMALDEFSDWIDAALEAHTFIPPAPVRGARVVITPLPLAIGRSFAAAVLPGADADRLGALAADPTLLDDTLRRAIGAPDRAARQRRAELAFVQLLRLPLLVALHRRAEGDAAVSLSPWIERAALSRSRRGAAAPQWRPAKLPTVPVHGGLQQRPAPSAGGGLPASLSASAVEALRQCPYRFFSRVVLHLSEHEELDNEVDKRDAGRWLHATLERFHRSRESPRDREADVAQLLAAGRETLQALEQQGQLTAEGLLPYSAGLAQLARRYVDWLHAQETVGWRFDAAEVEAKVAPADAQGLRLHGRIDRIDTRAAGREIRLIDYKTQSRASLKRKVAQPLEDTQLAVYAALQLDREPEARGMQALYLALDEAKEAMAVEHEQVADSAQTLIQALAGERARIDAGAPLPALGEGRGCDYCEARGLCRRDHWPGQGEEPLHAD